MNHARIARIGTVLAVLAIATAGLWGCGGQAQPSADATATPAASAAAFPVTITDDAGRQVTIQAEPKRIVSMAPANTEIVAALGMFDRLVGVTTWDDYPAEVKNVAKVGDFVTPNMEAVAGARPDVILVTGGVQADVISKLEAVGAKVVVVDPKSLEGVYSAIGSVAKVLGAAAKGDELIAGMKRDLAGIRAKVSVEPTVSAFVEIGWNPLFTAGKATLLDDLLTQAGGSNVVTLNDYVGYSVEQLVKDQPQVYLGTKSSIGDPSAIKKRAGYGALAAVKSGRVFTLDDNLVSRPGPRVVQGVEEIARVLHPDAFK